MDFYNIDRDSYEYFAPFLPQDVSHLGASRYGAVLGIVEKNEPVGAATLYVGEGLVNIDSLVYEQTLEPGSVERALTRFIIWHRKPLISITYTSCGTEEELEAYDEVMLRIGYIPRDGGIQRYHAILQDILDSQKDVLARYWKRFSEGSIVKGDLLTESQIRRYNQRYDAVPFIPDEDDARLSCFMIRDGEAVAGIHIKKRENEIEFEWMNANGIGELGRMELILHVIINAALQADRSMDVVICPFLDEVKSLVERFGLTPAPDGRRSRIYTLYVNNV